eukprot:Sspe_Gene.45653::Locus_22648_Transcript_1_1_Confidence_1.000_Length_1842::g.45653::m.45653
MSKKLELGVKLRKFARLGDEQGVRSLLKEGAPLEDAEGGVTALWLAAEAGRTEIVKALLEYNASPNPVRAKDEVSAVYVACQNGHLGVVEVLSCADGVDLNRPKGNGSSPLLISAQQNHLRIVERLLQAKVAVDARNQQGITPFMIACFMGNEEVAVRLLQHGATPSLVGGGRTGIQWAKERGHRHTVARVHHYLRICHTMTLRSPYVRELFARWLGVVKGKGERDREGQEEEGEEDEEEDEEDAGSNSSSGMVRTHSTLGMSATIRTISGTDHYSPLELAGVHGSRLRDVIRPDTLDLAGGVGGDEAFTGQGMPLMEAMKEFEGSVDGTASTLWSVPSCGDAEECDYIPFASRWDKPPTHSYLRRLEKVYEAEFGGKPPQADPPKTPPRAAPPQKRASPKPKGGVPREIEQTLRVIFKDPRDRERIRREFVVPSAPPRTPASPPPGVARCKAVNENLNMKIPQHGKGYFSLPGDERLNGQTSKHSAWKREMAKQAEREARAIRIATASAAVARLEAKALKGEVNAPQLVTDPPKTPQRHPLSPTPASPWLDSQRSAGYQRFHQPEFASSPPPGSFYLFS